jgi:RNA polymerase sigma-70 factor (ECF subfamily)
LLRNKEDAEDALQDALLRAYLHLGSFEGRARFSTWLNEL